MSGPTNETESSPHLRPVERAVLRLARRGKSELDIAWRLRRSPGWVQRTLALTELPRDVHADRRHEPWGLRPIERTVLRARERGIAEAEMASRLRRSPAFVRRVGAFADYKLARASGGSSG
jgi:DNA-binding CsgD family transcriptional regulator